MFTARMLDGPMDGQEMEMAAPHIPERLYYAPSPYGVAAVSPNGYMLVDVDGRAGSLDHPWPKQIAYRLDREQSNLHPHDLYKRMEVGTAVYTYVEPHEHLWITDEQGVSCGFCEERHPDELRERASFTCPRCGRTSHHPTDVEESYCANCHDWTGSG